MNKEILTSNNIQLNCEATSKEEAIKIVGNILINEGYVSNEYLQAMLNREAKVSTYIGNNVAIPHGEDGSSQYIKSSGLAVASFPNGVDFGAGNIAHIVIGIAGLGDEHMELLSNIALVIIEESNVEKLVSAQNKEEIISILMEEV